MRSASSSCAGSGVVSGEEHKKVNEGENNGETRNNLENMGCKSTT